MMSGGQDVDLLGIEMGVEESNSDTDEKSGGNDSLSGFLTVQNELIKSEEVYVNQLKVFLDTFLLPLEKYLTSIKTKGELNKLSTSYNGPNHHFILDRILFEDKIDVIDALFSNIKAIYDCNSMLVDALRQADAGNDQSNASFPVVATLLKYMPFLKIYSVYSKNFDRSNALLSRLEEGDVR